MGIVSAVLLEKDEDILDKIVYLACKSMSTGSVAKSELWPGRMAYQPEKTHKRTEKTTESNRRTQEYIAAYRSAARTKNFRQ